MAIREDADEVWATKVHFYQPQAAKSAQGGITTEYMYRVPAPTCSVLYKTVRRVRANGTSSRCSCSR